MEGSDDLSKLEELFAADSSDDETDLKNRKDNGNISDEQKKKPLFLEKENIELHHNNYSKSKKDLVNLTDDKFANSVVHSGDTDSSDDEDKKNYLERKYSDYGSDVKKLLQHRDEKKNEYTRNEVTSKSSISFKASIPTIKQPEASKLPQTKDIYTDPIFGIRIIKPLISSSVLIERMQGREAISMSKVKRHVTQGDLAKDWVIAGTIVRKSASKESQKGSQYTIWTLSDLKDDLKTVAVFLFRNAYKQLWKTNQATVVGILNPSVLDKRDDSTDEACLSVDVAEKVMVFGNSKDFGFCKSKKKNGDPCTAFVNVNSCSYCVYHVKQEYQKCSRRADLQSGTAGRGLADLRNKVLGKNTVIYGGQSYTAIPAVKSKKQTAKDSNRLQTLSDYFKPAERQPPMTDRSPGMSRIKKAAPRVEASRSQRLRDLERLEFLSAGSSKNIPITNNDIFQHSSLSIEKSKPAQIPVQHSLTPTNKTRDVSLKCPTLGTPVLGFGLKRSSMVDLTLPFSKKQSERAKSNAVKWIKQNGPINKNDPNNLRGTSEGKKRNLSKLNDSSERESNKDESENTPKKPKTGVASERFQKMLAATSAHANLIVQHDDSEADKYFDKLEVKEKMEEKMLNTFKVACKGVKCLKCSYTSFSAADRCKLEKHPLKVFDTFKRFFKCSHCSNRQVTLDLIPTNACNNCQHTAWRRAGMIAEKRVLSLASKLSITGEEEFLGHVQHGASIDLLLPEDGA